MVELISDAGKVLHPLFRVASTRGATAARLGLGGPGAKGRSEKAEGPSAEGRGAVEILGIAAERPMDAVGVFLLNVETFPEDTYGYDSLAEAYRVSSNRELATENYERSLELDPDNANANAVEMLKKLREE